MHCLVIHGGAGALPRSEMTPARAEEFHAGLREALLCGHRVLAAGGSSMDAVEAAVVSMEDNPLFNAGKGGSFTREGKNELEASIMDGHSGRVGTAMVLRSTRNPVRLARLVMERTPHVSLSGTAADAYAAAQGLPQEQPEYFWTRPRYEAMLKLRGTERTALSEDVVINAAPLTPDTSNTVGAVALDSHGHLAASTSSGGTSNKYAGRVGQACIPGAGVFAKDATCAVSCTGQGEAFIRGVIAYDVSAMMEYGRLDLRTAAERAIHQRLPGHGGLIAIDGNGNLATPFNSAGMFRGWIKSAGMVHTAIYEEVRAWNV